MSQTLELLEYGRRSEEILVKLGVRCDVARSSLDVEIRNYSLLRKLIDYEGCIDAFILLDPNGIKNISKFKSLMMGLLPELTSLSQDYSIVADFLKTYPSRLQQLVDRDNSLQELYGAYQEAFGGQE